MTEALLHGGGFRDRLRQASHWIFWIGVALTVLGAAAVIFPMFATLVATLFVGWMILLSGAVGLAGAFSIHGAGPFFGSLVLALLSIAAGIFLLVNPLAGEVALTLMLGMLFMLQGAFEIFFAFEMRPFSGWTGMLVAGLLSVAAALVIIAAWPGISLFVLGLLIGINFISSGIGYIIVSRRLKPAA